MTPRERELILKVADEVRTADRAAIDREAEGLIRAEVAAQSHAAYILAQRVIVQDLALQQARSRIDELEARLRQAGLPGGQTEGGAAAAPPASYHSGVGDFLRTAAAAAAGTIGGQLIYDGLRHWAAGHGGGHGTDGLMGGAAEGGFGPVGASRVEPDASDRDWGGGGDFGANAGRADAATADGSGGDWGDGNEEVADEEVADEDPADAGGGGDW